MPVCTRYGGNLHSIDPRSAKRALILQTREMERITMPSARRKVAAEPE